MAAAKTDRAGDELEAAVHEEIERLPERFSGPWYSVISRSAPTSRRPGISAGRSEPSRAGCAGRERIYANASPAAAWHRAPG